MRSFFPFMFLAIACGAFILNIFAIMDMIPLIITVPLLFISIYLTLFSFTHRHTFRGFR
ncbi:putative membrane protein YizD [Paraliobacillus quinghaiensis]|uniref:Membrane protein YizD n=1 Tax=Paraliobacillus quinghaiensis TaxID=470815 RepID=A0A917TIM0_9BACI|nr:putative membrane protein YizD [Paraliobacillus quinghaiensis]